MCTQAQIAQEYFEKGYNCAQSTAAAFADDLGIEASLLLRAMSGFGGGIAGRGEICGAASGMLLAAGFLFGSEQALPPQEKAALTDKMEGLLRRLEEEWGCVNCKELLDRKEPSLPRREYCSTLVQRAAALLAEEAGLAAEA